MDTHWWEVFCLLHVSRPTQLDGPGAIPLSEIDAYCRLTGITEAEARETVMELIRTIDEGYLELVEARSKKKVAVSPALKGI